MARLKTNIPAPTGGGGHDNMAARVTALENALFELYCDLEYVLSHIDSDNFTDEGIAEIKARIGGDTI